MDEKDVSLRRARVYHEPRGPLVTAWRVSPPFMRHGRRGATWTKGTSSSALIDRRSSAATTTACAAAPGYARPASLLWRAPNPSQCRRNAGAAGASRL